MKARVFCVLCVGGVLLCLLKPAAATSPQRPDWEGENPEQRPDWEGENPEQRPDWEVKPGVCPRRRPRPGLCAELCANDGDCPRNQKCCSTGCGHQCTSPHTTVKPGVCPRRRPRPGLCAELCANDGDCPRNQKCCSNGCGHQCTSPHTTVTPGLCALLEWMRVCRKLLP
ncbi:WAP four-disulfide core domain protein 2-like isoform X2 [Triplophysa rosa]|uniref:WAP four-disulfide core domain protein 2-like isoform X2 n=1 Tax=Triplophysa rosa TaxID=992332 RepID=UPI002545FF6F|nr:WAP four-disulfide core domain protein 2-like isoform X2 [Triplophysa rosa]